MLGINDKSIFYKYLDKSKVYFEFGSGGSTWQVSLRPNIEYMYSVESDLEWHNKLKEIINDTSKIKFIYNEMNTAPNNYGHPGENSTFEQRKSYSEQILLLNPSEQKKIDLILIDGRFRVACCLKCFDVIRSDCFIAFDDFLNRPQYHIVLEYYDIVDKTSDNRLVILKKKQGIRSIDRRIIEKYEIIVD